MGGLGQAGRDLVPFQVCAPRALVQTRTESWEGAKQGEYVPVLPPAGYIELWGWEVSALSARHCPGGRCGAAARPEGAAAADAPGEDRVAAGPRGQVRGRGEAAGWWRPPFSGIWDDRPLSPQEHQELPAATVVPWHGGTCAWKVAFTLSSSLLTIAEFSKG